MIIFHRSALYAAIRHLPNDHQGIIRLPDHTLLNWHLNEVFTRPFEIREFFSRSFFGFLANHLLKMGERNRDWLRAALKLESVPNSKLQLALVGQSNQG